MWKSAEEYKRDQDAQNAKEGTSDHDPKGTPKTKAGQEIIAKLPESFVKDFIAAQKEESRRDEKRYRIEKFGAWVGAIYVVFTGLILWTNSCQLRTLKEQMRADQRPYLIVHKLRMYDPQNNLTLPSIGVPIAVTYDVNNVGKSDARNVIETKHILFGKQFPSKFQFDPPLNPEHRSGGYIGPGDAVTVTVVSTNDTFDPQNQGVDFVNIIGWDGSDIFVFGRITYEDSSGYTYCAPFMAQLLHVATPVPGGVWADINEFRDPVTKEMRNIETLCPVGTLL